MNRVQSWLHRSRNGTAGHAAGNGQAPGAGPASGAPARAGAAADAGVVGGDAAGSAHAARTHANGDAHARAVDLGPAVRPESITVHVTELPAEAADGFGAFEITKKTDFWFDLEVARLERDAREEAVAQAKAGTPRPGVADDALAIEKHLEARAAELFRRWAERVRTKVSDAVADAARQAGARLLEYRGRVASLRKALRRTEAAESEVERLRAAPPTGAASLGFTSFLKGWHYWLLMVVLVGVDWVANVPVFAELVPREPGAEEQWATIVANSERYGIFGGLYRVGARILFAPDVSLLAFGVIVFLVFLAHVFGESMRQRIAIREEDLPAASPGIRSHRRQFVLPAALSGLGVLLVIGVLFMARERIEAATDQRLRDAQVQVSTLEAQLADARARQDLDGIARAQRQLPEARTLVEERGKRAQYAAGIEAMNLPILVLNLVLVIAASLAAYLAKGETLEQRRLVDPRLKELEAELGRLREEAQGQRERLRQLGADILDRLALAQRLLHARPLAGWEGKAQRLAGVVPLFRAENARERALDPANILAFQRPSALSLPAVDADAPLDAPPELLTHAAEFERLRADWLELEAGEAARHGPETEGGDVA
ncbi:MAG TPA: hypothetical protein VFQ38_18650 [Longimicrobiales bacterium]|nr:hypothetical protein [Longimicrobiales bacterium]